MTQTICVEKHPKCA